MTIVKSVLSKVASQLKNNSFSRQGEAFVAKEGLPSPSDVSSLAAAPSLASPYLPDRVARRTLYTTRTVAPSSSDPYPSAALSTAVDASSSVPSLQAIVTSAVDASSQAPSTPDMTQCNGIDVLVNVLENTSNGATRERKKVDVNGTKKKNAKEMTKFNNMISLVRKKGFLKEYPDESISRALKSYSVDDIDVMTKEKIENAYSEWRGKEAARRKVLRKEKRKTGATDIPLTNTGAIVTPLTNVGASDTPSTNAGASDTPSTNTGASDTPSTNAGADAVLHSSSDIDVALASYGLGSHDVGGNGDCQFLAAGHHLEVSAGDVRRLVVAELRDLAMKYPLFSDRLRKKLFPSHSDSASL